MKKLLIIILIILILLICGILIFNANVEVEYVPEKEIGDVDLRRTMITLYFPNKENKQLQKESRLIDSKDLLLEPYEELINMLINGPESDHLDRIVPEGTKLLKVELIGDCLNINFSDKFSEIKNEEDKNICINSITNTLTELNEVNSIKIFVEGNEINV